MPKIAVGANAPEFEMKSVQGQTLRLSDYRNQKVVLLVFNRGFV